MNIYVGNLSRGTTEDDLRQVFEAFGEVISVKMIRDRATGESWGFGFVGMPVRNEAKTAISEMNGKDLKGQTIKVEEGRMKASHRPSRDRRGGSSDGRGGGGRGGGFGRDDRGAGATGGGFGRGGPRY